MLIRPPPVLKISNREGCLDTGTAQFTTTRRQPTVPCIANPTHRSEESRWMFSHRVDRVQQPEWRQRSEQIGVLLDGCSNQ